jgi:hypothetical protein
MEVMFQKQLQGALILKRLTAKFVRRCIRRHLHEPVKFANIIDAARLECGVQMSITA